MRKIFSWRELALTFLILGVLAAACTPALGPSVSSEAQGVLYLGIMVHLEGWDDQTSRVRFDRHVQLMREYADLFEAYGAKLTWESKEVTEGVLKWGDNVLLEMEQRGHGIGVHADVGGERNYDCSRFAADLRAKKKQLESLGVTVRHVSGICSHCDWVTAAADAGYLFTTGQVAYCCMSLPLEKRPPEFRNCPNPAACHQPFPTDLKDRIHPWRMHSGADWLTHDPNGRLVLLPSSGGLTCMQEETSSPTTSHTRCEFTQEDIDAFIRQLEEALSYVEPDKVNIYYVSWSLGSPLDKRLLEAWLQRIQPYVQSGRVQWKTLPEMYDAYVAWEKTHASVIPTLGTSSSAQPVGTSAHFMLMLGESPFGLHAAYLPAHGGSLMAAETGAKWMTDRILWDQIEPTKGSFDFRAVDQVVLDAQKYGLRSLPRTRSISRWGIPPETPTEVPGSGSGCCSAFPKDEESLEHYKLYLRKLVERYDGDGEDDMPGLTIPIKYWQMENEWTHNFWAPDRDGNGESETEAKEDLLRLFTITYNEIKAADPEAVVVLGSIVGVEYFALYDGLIPEPLVVRNPQTGALTYITRRDLERTPQFWRSYNRARFILDRADSFCDRLGINIRQTLQYVDEQLRWLRDYTRSKGYTKEIWVGEAAGPNLDREEYNFAKHSSQIVQRYAIALANGVEKMFWSPFAASSPRGTPMGPDGIFGIVALYNAHTGEARPAYYTYKVMTSKLANFSSVEELNLGQGIYAYKFQVPTGPVLVLWSTEPRVADLGAYFPSDRVLITHVITEPGETQAREEIVPSKAVPVGPNTIFVEVQR